MKIQIAQLAERRIFHPDVVGSSPTLVFRLYPLTNSPVSTLSYFLKSIFSPMEYSYCKGGRDGSPSPLPQLLQGEYLYQMNPWNDLIFLMGLFIISKVFLCLLCHGLSIYLSVSWFAWFAWRVLQGGDD